MKLITTLIVLLLNLLYTTQSELQELKRPYRLQYSKMSEMDLVFGFEDEYGRFQKWMTQGGSDQAEFRKFLLRINSYLTEWKERQVGNIAPALPELKRRAQEYEARNSVEF